jgi:DMSO reductase anchor subunit
MNPPLSMLLFTVLAGAAQGLVVALFGVEAARALERAVAPDAMLLAGVGLAFGLGVCGLAAATFHLGHPLRAWRAVAMWRTSWLSREVIVLPAFLATLLVWGWTLAQKDPWFTTLLPAAGAALLALVLFLCTGMIYAAIKAMRAWATPLTPLNFCLLGMASGGLLASVLAALWAPGLLPALLGWSLVCLALGAIGRAASLRRSLQGTPAVTLQSALGIRHPKIVQMSEGTLGRPFNRREFEHGRSAATLARVRWAAAGAGFVLPAAGLVLALVLPELRRPAGLAGLVAVHLGGLLAERWHFFAEARHTQNLYQQGRS